MLPILAAITLAGISTCIAIGGLTVSPNAIQFKWDAINPATVVGRAFSTRTVVRLVTSVAKLFLVSIISWVYLRNKLELLATLRWAWSTEIIATIAKITATHRNLLIAPTVTRSSGVPAGRLKIRLERCAPPAVLASATFPGSGELLFASYAPHPNAVNQTAPGALAVCLKVAPDTATMSAYGATGWPRRGHPAAPIVCAGAAPAVPPHRPCPASPACPRP